METLLAQLNILRSEAKDWKILFAKAAQTQLRQVWLANASLGGLHLPRCLLCSGNPPSRKGLPATPGLSLRGRAENLPKQAEVRLAPECPLAI